MQQPAADEVAGIGAHEQVFSVAVLDGRGGRCAVAWIATSPEGLAEALARLDSFAFAVGRIGGGGSAGLGRHVTQALVAAGDDVPEGRPTAPLSVAAGGTRPTARTPRRSPGRRWPTRTCHRRQAARSRPGQGGVGRGPQPAQELIGQRVRLLNEAEAVLTALPLPVQAARPQTSRVRPRRRALHQAWPARSNSRRPTRSISPG